MPPYTLEVPRSPAWAPLEQLARVCDSDPALPSFEARDLMCMARLVAVGRPTIHLYKHVESRQYLCIDAQGHAVSARWLEGDMVDARPLPDLSRALEGVLAPQSPGRRRAGSGRARSA